MKYDVFKNIDNRIQEVANEKFKTDQWRPNDKALKQMNISRNRWRSIASNKSQPKWEEAFYISTFLNTAIIKLVKPVVVKDIHHPAKQRTLSKLENKYLNVV